MGEGPHGKLHLQQLDHVKEANVGTTEVLHHHLQLPQPRITELDRRVKEEEEQSNNNVS